MPVLLLNKNVYNLNQNKKSFYFSFIKVDNLWIDYAFHYAFSFFNQDIIFV